MIEDIVLLQHEPIGNLLVQRLSGSQMKVRESGSTQRIRIAEVIPAQAVRESELVANLPGVFDE